MEVGEGTQLQIAQRAVLLHRKQDRGPVLGKVASVDPEIDVIHADRAALSDSMSIKTRMMI